MPKNTDAVKSKMRSKSTRKPLRDVSNAKIGIKSANISKKTSKDDGGQTGDDSLDRLLLVQSDLSSILRQIDELVVQALQLTSNKGRKEIKQFADVLSDMQTSLKPWVPRLQKALSSQSIGPENKSEQSMERTVLSVPEESTNIVIESPEQTKWESLVSPSPLVSWRAECNTEGGRQLFLLTPMPQKKAFSSKCEASSIPAFEKVTSDETSHLLTDLGNDLPDSVSAKPTPNKVLGKQATKAVGNLHTKCGTPAKFSESNCSMFVMTPCLKMSPPKSCILLEPISEFCRKKTLGVHKSTPFPAKVQNSIESPDSESSSSQSSDDLSLKYPELFGIKINNLEKRTVAEDSPTWVVSPPKTCVIMEPADEKLLKINSGKRLLPKTTAACHQQDDKKIENQDDHAKTHQQSIRGTLNLVESTPMMKERVSSFQMGKQPGENTLKKELWTRFEAASTHGPILHDDDDTRKGFLDRLDEALES
ncbi:hypothetical protein DH2020_041103 [Rehmannia glutinosa]|uniref:Uncharacterized protein n=1 Tax=Rehmannia glutinosa TaxID=99300 RepID=A0ABR0US90_REHGL